jgi:hypothetical protein
MIYAGEEHQAIPLMPDFELLGVSGTLPPGGRETRLYKDYVPSLQLHRTPIR